MEPCSWSPAGKLLASARAGDLNALDRLLSLQRTELLRSVRRALGARLAARVEAEDLFQEASLQAMRSITSLRADELSGFRRWFLGIVRHRVLLLVEASRPRKRPRRTTPLPDAHLLFQDPKLIESASPEESRAHVDETRTGERVRTLFADGRLTMLMHEIFESGWGTIAFLLDRPSREAARQVHVRMRGRFDAT